MLLSHQRRTILILESTYSTNVCLAEGGSYLEELSAE